jgi:hypothetical protein
MNLVTRGMGAVAAAMMIVGFAPAANAAWTFNPSDCSGEPSIGGTSSTGAIVKCYADGTGTGVGKQDEVSISAWTTGSGSSFTAAQLGYYQNGVGNTEFTVVSSGDTTSNSTHAMDNNGKTEFLMFNFAESFKLTSFLTGWATSDSDVTIMAYTGNSPPPVVNGKTVDSLVATDGWSLVGNCNNTNPTLSGSNSTSYNVSDCVGGNTNLTSSWWIISAYNGVYKNPNTTGWDTSKDYVKIAAIAGVHEGNDAPEPASLALLAIGLAAAAGTMRRRPGVPRQQLAI